MTFLRTRSWLIFCFVCMLLLTGCGFHLRKGITLTHIVQPIYIHASAPNSTLVQLIENQLKANDIALTSSRQAAKLILNISKIQSNTQLTSLRGGSQSGQYTVTISVTINAIDINGRALIKPNTITQQSTYSSNETQTLSSNYTSSTITNSMQQNLANQVLLQIAAIDRDTNPHLRPTNTHQHHETEPHTSY